MRDPWDDRESEPSPLVTLNFLVHRDVRRRFKQCALDADISQKELLHRMMDAWEGREAVPRDGDPD